MAQISQDIQKSIQYGLDHREEAMAYAIQFSRGLDLQKVDRFIGMYVNELTLDYGEDGREAVRRFCRKRTRRKSFPRASIWNSSNRGRTTIAWTQAEPLFPRSLSQADERRAGRGRGALQEVH